MTPNPTFRAAREAAEDEEEQRWWPICQIHGFYNIREIRCPECSGKAEALREALKEVL